MNGIFALAALPIASPRAMRSHASSVMCNGCLQRLPVVMARDARLRASTTGICLIWCDGVGVVSE